MLCPYCCKLAYLVSGQAIYPHRQDLWAKRFWKCDPCQAWVGCHEGTDRPFGRLADKHLRAAKSRAHIAFDEQWLAGTKSGRRRRREYAYRLLATQLGIDREDCHIGLFDIQTCAEVVKLCGEWEEP